MKISSEQLSTQLKKKLAPIYLISGDETLLIEETTTQIRTAARQNGFTEQKIFQVDSNFNWDEFTNTTNNLSLFSERSIIELRFTNKKINDAGKKTLLVYAGSPPDDKLLVISIKKLDTSTQNTKWFKTFEKNVLFIPIWPITRQQLPLWIQNRLRSQGMSIESTALQFIADQVEGNLLAAKQEIEKLYLLYGEKHLTLDEVISASSDHAHFDIFNLVDCALSGDKKRALRILTHLKNEAAEPILILWSLAKEIRALLNMKEQCDRGENIEAVLRQNGIWEKRKTLFRSSLNRHSQKTLTRLLHQAAQIDRVIKGALKDNVWILFNKLTLNLCNHYNGR